MTAPKQRVVQVLPILLGLIVIYAIFIAATGGRDAKRNEAIQAQKDADWHRTNDAQWALVRSLSTPKAFQDRCGKASMTRHASGATTLIYQTPPSEMYVTFSKTKDFPLVMREHLHEKVFPFIPYDGLVEMGCVKK